MFRWRSRSRTLMREKPRQRNDSMCFGLSSPRQDLPIVIQTRRLTCGNEESFPGLSLFFIQ